MDRENLNRTEFQANLPAAPAHPNPPPLVRVSGTHREMGRQIGEACAVQVRHSIQNACKLLEASYDYIQLTWDGAQIQARKYIPFAQERYPQYIDELQGIAEGAGVSFYDVAVVNAMEAVTMDALHLTKCTSMAVNEERTADGHVLMAHNEDWLPEDENDVYIVEAYPKDEPAFMAMSYGCLLANVGFNAAGIAQCCDSVYPNDSRIGIPRVVNSRAVLAARTPAEAIRHMLVSHRAAGYNHQLVHESGEMYNVEVSARNFGIQYVTDGIVVHTNHFLDRQMRTIEEDPDELVDTRVRYFRAYRLLHQTNKHSVKTLQAIQRDHLNAPNSICNHVEEDDIPLDREKTINSLVIDLTARAMYLSWGNPCTNPYHLYHLDA
jgi:isopenicillin-N N-acyltransferase like protein